MLNLESLRASLDAEQSAQFRQGYIDLQREVAELRREVEALKQSIAETATRKGK